MNQGQVIKTQVSVAPIDNNGATATATAVDSNGCGSLVFHITFGVQTGVISVLKLQECDTSGGSYADVTNAAFVTGGSQGGQTNFSTTASAGKTYQLVVNMGGSRKRYFKPVITNAAGAALVSCIAVGYNVAQAPDTLTERGVLDYIVI
jgi:hypothetical protein